MYIVYYLCFYCKSKKNKNMKGKVKIKKERERKRKREGRRERMRMRKRGGEEHAMNYQVMQERVSSRKGTKIGL